MAERLIIVGGDAAGMSAASQARRRRGPDDLEILAFERSSFVSYSACGEPYYVGGYVTDINQLQARTPAEFKAMDIDVRTQHEVIAIAPREGKVTVRAVQQGTEETYGYDLLVYATGASPFLPPIAGLDLAGVHVMGTLDDALAVRRLVVSGVRYAVVVGGGYIGLEVAEAFHHQPTFKGSDCTDRFCTLRALHTMRSRDPARPRAGGDGLGHRPPAPPLDRLSIIGPGLPGPTRIAPPPPSVSLSRLCSLAPAGPGYGDKGAPAAE